LPDPFPSDSVIENTEFLAVYRAALVRLQRFGLSANPTCRLAVYERRIAELGAIDEAELSSDQRLVLANALCEASIIVDIASLPDRYLDAIRPRLLTLKAGSEFENVEKPDRARDAAAELQFAARCHTRGGLGDPAMHRGDVLVRTPSGQFPAEIKRVSSSNRIRQRVKEAVSQLGPAKEGEPWGVIVLDVSAAVRMHFGFVEANTMPEFLDIAGQQVTSFLRHYVIGALNYNEVAREGILGILVRHVAYGWVGGSGNVRRSISTQALPLVEEGGLSESIFLEITRSIETGESVEGNEDAMRAAVDAYPLPIRRRAARRE